MSRRMHVNDLIFSHEIVDHSESINIQIKISIFLEGVFFIGAFLKIYYYIISLLVEFGISEKVSFLLLALLR